MAGMATVEDKKGLNSNLIEDPEALQAHVLRVLHENSNCGSLFGIEPQNGMVSSSVMLLLGRLTSGNGGKPETCIILNKRSQKVRQPGDLCCPGGTVEAHLDPYLARLLSIPGSPLARWPHWHDFRGRRPHEARLISLLLAAGLRESWEEMRLNPFNTRFLGPLPSQNLILFHRVIHPMVGWVNGQKRFFPSWEVEKIVTVPLRSLLNPSHYACYRLSVSPHLKGRFSWNTRDFPCFLYSYQNQTELLWGVTYRIVTLLLDLVFGFRPPDPATLPLVLGKLNEAYINGQPRI
jgi:8-oxo-dGTP pyrophosphatase MutT (NUDIX family)